LLLLLAGASSACATPGVNPARPHHTADGFINPQEQETIGFLDFLKWRWQRGDIPGPEAYQFPLVRPDLDFLRKNRSVNTATWIGHATFLLQLDGLNILTDPHFSERASPVQWAGPRRVVPPAIALDDLPPIDFVVISHDHYDSLDVDTVRGLRRRAGGELTTFVVPLKLKQWFLDAGIDKVVELDWWEAHAVNDVVITAVPAQHWSKRTPFSRNATLWAGWVVKTATFNFYFAGDSGYHPPLFREIGQRLGPFDLAAIPIGAYEPRWFMSSKHLNPEEAVRVHQDVKARQSVAMHWGTFILTDEPLTEPPQRLRAALHESNLPQESFKVLQHGEMLRLSGE
jgi:L-ascorbate metabolism protein UlaG (beta-lactamase superfamily)